MRVLSEKVTGYIAKMPPVWVEGQLVEIKRRQGAWLAFLTLRDTDVDVSLPLSCPAKKLDQLGPGLQDGAKVVVALSPEFWARRGTLQFKIDDIRLSGEGDLLAQLEQLKRKLHAEGLLADHLKKPLPFMPRIVGLICGRDSAAERDVVVTATTRWPGVVFATREVAVQGPTAAKAVTAALQELDATDGVDVIILARGGGSLEDLLAFSDESLVRAVAACQTPTVSAIGHEVDCPVVDLVADVRASTPTDAGRRVVPAVTEERTALAAMVNRLRSSTGYVLRQQVDQLRQVQARPVLADPMQGFTHEAQQIHVTLGRLRYACTNRLTTEHAAVASMQQRVRALSPLATLQRGYAVVRNADGHVVRAATAAVAEQVEVTFHDGQAHAQITSTTPRE